MSIYDVRQTFHAEWLEWVRSAQKTRACFPASGRIMGLGVCRWVTGDWFWLSAGARRLSFGSRAPFGSMQCWETLGHVLPSCYNAAPYSPPPLLPPSVYPVCCLSFCHEKPRLTHISFLSAEISSFPRGSVSGFFLFVSFLSSFFFFSD